MKVPGRHAGMYSKRRRKGAEKHNRGENMRTEMGRTVGKLLHKLQNWLSLFRYYTGYNTLQHCVSPPGNCVLQQH
jgi:hypothetical protein